MKVDIISYLTSIDSSLKEGKSVQWNLKCEAVNSVLRCVTDIDVPPAPTGPLCVMDSCNIGVKQDGDFCCPEHKDIYEREKQRPIKVRIIGNCWRNSTDTMKEFGVGCSDTTNYRWGRIQLVDDDSYDYTVMINAPGVETRINKDKTIIFHMEPNMEIHSKTWGPWSNPEGFLRVFKHSTDMNNLQWHLGKTYSQLMSELEKSPIEKEDKVSMVISGKYTDIGHVYRWDFATMLSENKRIPLVLYGANNRFRLPGHRGALPHLNKDEGMYPYKYHIAMENHSNWNYVTEKLVDGILAECLTFYWGAPNIEQLIDPRAYVRLEMGDMKKDMEIIERAIKEDWWSQRIEYIREAKRRIINEQGFIPRLERYIVSQLE